MTKDSGEVEDEALVEADNGEEAQPRHSDFIKVTNDNGIVKRTHKSTIASDFTITFGTKISNDRQVRVQGEHFPTSRTIVDPEGTLVTVSRGDVCVMGFRDEADRQFCKLARINNVKWKEGKTGIRHLPKFHMIPGQMLDDPESLQYLCRQGR